MSSVFEALSFRGLWLFIEVEVLHKALSNWSEFSVNHPLSRRFNSRQLLGSLQTWLILSFMNSKTIFYHHCYLFGVQSVNLFCDSFKVTTIMKLSLKWVYIFLRGENYKKGGSYKVVWFFCYCVFHALLKLLKYYLQI